MIDFDKLAEKYRLLWSRENHDRPFFVMYAPRERIDWSRMPKAPDTAEERWLDAEYNIRRHRFYMQETQLCLAEAFPQAWVNFGPDIMGAICGCGIEFGQDTSWAVHTWQDKEVFPDIRFDEKDAWFRRLQQCTEAFAEDSRGEYVVGITDLHPGPDCLVSLRGPEALCIDLIESPEMVKKANFQVLEVFKKVFEAQYRAATKYMPYTSNWMNIFSADREYVTSCDFSCLISKEMYAEFVLPELREEWAFLDSSIYHLDGTAALTHLDALCAEEKLRGIQWVPGSGQKPMREWLPVLQKIQKSGKMIDITVESEDVLPLLSGLAPEGVVMHCNVKSREEGEALLAAAERACTQRRKGK